MKKVLVIAANDAVRKTLVLILENSCKVIEACNGLKGITTLQEDPSIKFVIIDNQMPEMDGLMVIKCIRQAKLDTKTMLISGRKEFEEIALKAGADYFMEKPFVDVRDIVSLVTKN